MTSTEADRARVGSGGSGAEGQAAPRRRVQSYPAGLVRLLEEDPDLGCQLEDSAAAAARQHLVAPARRLSSGAWDHQRDPLAEEADLGALVLDGILTRRVFFGERRSVEVLGPGDLLRPRQPDCDEYATLASTASWRVLQPARIAVLDHAFVARSARVPPVLCELTARAIQRSRFLAVQLAIAQLPRLEDRVQLLLWRLADRWGRREAGAVALDVRLPQETLAELVAAKRTSVSAALKELAARGLVGRRPGGSWALYGEPPAIAKGAAACERAAELVPRF